MVDSNGAPMAEHWCAVFCSRRFTMMPLMKWSGSKRSQSDEICSRIGRGYGTYYEPFLGGGSIMFTLMRLDDGRFRKFVGSDLNADLIATYNAIRSRPHDIVDAYREHYRSLVSLSMDERKKYFNRVRSRLNSDHDPCDFFWIMRTTTNGMPRYNGKGEFNNSLHVTRDGMAPDAIEKIVLSYSSLMNRLDVEFRSCPYSDIAPEEGDFAYFDPPYAATKGMYYGSIDNDALFSYLGELKCDWMMSFDGKAGDDDMTADVPKEIYDTHEYIRNGNSSFRRVIGKDRDCIVYESLYSRKRK